MKTVIIIPARYESSRFPGKPLALIKGISLLQRTWQIARQVSGVEQVIVATDDSRIVEHTETFGGQALLTPKECENGTERCLRAVELLNYTPDLILNLQGDAPLTPPWVLQDLIDYMKQHPDRKMATPAVKLAYEQYSKILKLREHGVNSGTLVTFDRKQKALYFSRYPIPFMRNKTSSTPAYKHLGIYAYTFSTLQEYIELEPTPLEKTEGLEQLRALESGIDIDVVLTDLKNRTQWSLDNPEDLKIIEEILEKEGEL